MGNPKSTEQPEEDATRKEEATLTEKYSFALELLKSQVQTLWTIFGIFLIAETVLLGALANSFRVGQMMEIVFVGALFGLLLAIPWWSTFEYARSFYLLRIEQAKQFEPMAGSLLTEGADLRDKRTLVKGIRIGRFVRFMSHHRSGSYLIMLFGAAFILIALAVGNELFK